MKKKFIYFICCVLIIESFIGCTPFLFYRPEMKLSDPVNSTEFKNIRILIDDYNVKNSNNSYILIKKIYSSLSHSFSNVSICTSCPQEKNTLYVIPKKVIIEHDEKNMNSIKKVHSIIEVSYNSGQEIFRYMEEGKSYIIEYIKSANKDGDLVAMFIALPCLIALGGIAFSEMFIMLPFSTFYYYLSGDSDGLELYFKLHNNAQFNAINEDISVNFHNELISSTKFQKFANPIKLQQTKPALIEINPEYTDHKSIIPNNIIDAGENSQINIALTNKGEGTAYNVILKSNTNDNKVNLQNNIKIG
ncbi:conserved hypothetical protein, membrane, partial [Candidatus Magnetomorum sp. HK-1]